MEGATELDIDHHRIFWHPKISAFSGLSADDPWPRTDCSGVSGWRESGAWSGADSPRVRARTLILLRTPHPCQNPAAVYWFSVSSGKLTASMLKPFELPFGFQRST